MIKEDVVLGSEVKKIVNEKSEEELLRVKRRYTFFYHLVKFFSKFVLISAIRVKIFKYFYHDLLISRSLFPNANVNTI